MLSATRCLWCSTGAELKVHEPTKELMRKHYESQGKELNAARLRMATLPEGAEVTDTLVHLMGMSCLHTVHDSTCILYSC